MYITLRWLGKLKGGGASSLYAECAVCISRGCQKGLLLKETPWFTLCQYAEKFFVDFSSVQMFINSFSHCLIKPPLQFHFDITDNQLCRFYHNSNNSWKINVYNGKTSGTISLTIDTCFQHIFAWASFQTISQNSFWQIKTSRKRFKTLKKKTTRNHKLKLSRYQIIEISQ